MKRKLFSGIGFALAITLLATVMLPLMKTEAATVTLEVLNPKGIIEAPPLIPLAPRLDTLEGKRIAIAGYTKDSGNWENYAGAIADLLHEKYGYLSDANPYGVEIVIGTVGGYGGDVLGEKGFYAYDAWVRGATNGTGYTTTTEVDAVISGLAN